MVDGVVAKLLVKGGGGTYNSAGGRAEWPLSF
jgi:hypothetical protein